MNEIINTLLNIRRLRLHSKELTLHQLEDAANKLGTIVRERREKNEIEKMEAMERQRKLQSVAEVIKSQGVNIEELLALMTMNESKTQRKKRPPKYKYTTSDGLEKTWTGQGRTPKEIAKALDEGLELSDFKIQ